MSTSLVAVRQELEDARAIANAARVAEEAGRQQLARMMDEAAHRFDTLLQKPIRKVGHLQRQPIRVRLQSR
jgi:hypothetical protein